MPLTNDKTFGVRALSDAINQLPVNPTIIRSLNLFTPKNLSTTYVEVEYQDGKIRLVGAVKRGLPGEPVDPKARRTHTFNMLHLPVNDVVRADDVQNLRAFGSADKTVAVADVVNDKLADAKANIEYTREHLMLGALLGKILNADGTELININERLGATRKTHTWNLGTATTEVGKEIDQTRATQSNLQKGEAVSGHIVLASAEFLEALVYHPTVKEAYLRYQVVCTTHPKGYIMNLTIFGKLIRKIRLERLMRLKDMAEGIGVTSAFLSSVESGSKEMPDNMVEKIIHFLELGENETSQLLKAVDETRKAVTIQMPSSTEDRYLIGAFARNLEALDATRKEQILKLLRGEDE